MSTSLSQTSHESGEDNNTLFTLFTEKNKVSSFEHMRFILVCLADYSQD